ncbi:MAG: hypothetical protein LBD28_03315 [Tannerellaceae bacterium]|jgi:uncharacterized protein YneF (UPF0154 family)|nr:hypothetical protein [Tannerellaceae bacterium]
MLVTLLVTLIIVLACFILLALGIFLGRRDAFPSGHIDDSPALRDKGIRCAAAQDREQRAEKNLNEITRV